MIGEMPLRTGALRVGRCHPAQVRRNEPLSVRPVEVLQWIGDSCTDGVWWDFTCKTTACALASRGSVRVDRRRKHWLASLTDEGKIYLAHGNHRSDRDPIVSTHVSTESDLETDDLASGRLAELGSAGGQIIVESPWRSRGASTVWPTPCGGPLMMLHPVLSPLALEWPASTHWTDQRP